MDLDVNKMTVVQLKDFLRARGKRCSGKKADLVALVKLFKDDPLLSVPEDDSPQNVEFPETWIDVKSLRKQEVPPDFNIDVLNRFLTTQFLEVDGETISSGTEKPAVKGRQLYASEKIQFCEYAQERGLIHFRCNMTASMRNVFR